MKELPGHIWCRIIRSLPSRANKMVATYRLRLAVRSFHCYLLENPHPLGFKEHFVGVETEFGDDPTKIVKDALTDLILTAEVSCFGRKVYYAARGCYWIRNECGERDFVKLREVRRVEGDCWQRCNCIICAVTLSTSVYYDTRTREEPTAKAGDARGACEKFIRRHLKNRERLCPLPPSNFYAESITTLQ